MTGPSVPPSSPLSATSPLGTSSPGHLRVYLGFAAGVGKTFAMLDEGQRRARRGAIVRIGSMNTQNRAPIAELVAELQRNTGTNELRDFGDPLPVKTLLQELPNVVLVDELARPNPDGATNPYRWQDVQILLDHGIDVVTTLAIGEIESMSDVVSRITGKSPLGRVPDVFVCSTAQIELVDMSPQALRRRLAHGDFRCKTRSAQRHHRSARQFFRHDIRHQRKRLALDALRGDDQDRVVAHRMRRTPDHRAQHM